MKSRFQVHRGLSILIGMAFCAPLQIWGQADYMPPMSGWPAAIQTSWQIQGEYYGTQTNGAAILGAWLVSNGGNNYGLVILPGGLVTIPGQPNGGWNNTTRYQGATGPAPGILNGKIFNVSTTTGGFIADSITGVGEARTLYVHTATAAYILQRVKRKSPTLGLKPSQVAVIPGGAGVVSYWDSATGTADLSKWVTRDNPPSVKYGYLYRGCGTAASFGTHLLHIEFLSCFNPTTGGQNRANSGIYLQNHYELQVLDAFGLAGAIDEYGAIYALRAPIVNAELPPQVTLQTYDVYIVARSSGVFGDAVGAATVTIYANGVLVQNATPMANITPAGSATAGNGPLYLQNHNNEVVYNNIWVVPNATVTSLPYPSLLPAVSIDSRYVIKPLLQKQGLELLGFGGRHDMTGRKIRRNGAVLSVQPSVLFSPKN